MKLEFDSVNEMINFLTEQGYTVTRNVQTVPMYPYPYYPVPTYPSYPITINASSVKTGYPKIEMRK